MTTRMHPNAHAKHIRNMKFLLRMVLRSTVRRLRSLEPTWLSTARASFRDDANRATGRPSGRTRGTTAEQQAALTDTTHHWYSRAAGCSYGYHAPSRSSPLSMARSRACHASLSRFPRATHPCDFEENRAAENNFNNFYLWFSRPQCE